MSKQKISMYRPYFSGAELEILINSLEKTVAESQDATELELYKKLRLIKYRIQNDLISPALVRKESTAESVGAVRSEMINGDSEQKERLEFLATKHMKGKEGELPLTKNELAEGKRLELLEYGSNMGLFN